MIKEGKKEKSFFETMKEKIPPDKKQSGIGFITTPDEVLALCAIAEELHLLNEKLEKITTMDERAVKVFIKSTEGAK